MTNATYPATPWILDALSHHVVSYHHVRIRLTVRKVIAIPAATVTSKGQLTIPKAIRDKFKLKTGDRIEFLEESGKIIMIPASVDLVALGSVLPPPRRHVSIEQMNRAIEAHAVRRFRRK